MSGAPQELPTSQEPYSTFWFRTRLGTLYYLPDMLPQHVDEARRQLDLPVTNIALRNISDVAMVVPRRIIKSAGVNDRCFWEAGD